MAAVMLAFTLATPAAAAPGALTQLPGTRGCVSENGTGGECVDGRALGFATDVAVSGDGENVYAVGYFGNSIAVFRRDALTGRLTQLTGTKGCIHETGNRGCADGKALRSPENVTVSPDGRNLYVLSEGSFAVAVFRRDPDTGQLTQLAGQRGCISETGTGGQCTNGKALIMEPPGDLVVGSDGRSVYVSSGGGEGGPGAVAILRRDPDTGALTQLAGTAGCISETGSGGDCVDGKALRVPRELAASADGKNIYGASQISDSVAVFRRDPVTGRLTQLSGTAGCISETGTGGRCADGRALRGSFTAAVAPGDKHLYVGALEGDAVAVLRRDPGTGALTQPDGRGGCVSSSGSSGACAEGRAIRGPFSLAVSGDGRSLYVTSGDQYAIAVFRRDADTGRITQLSGTEGCAEDAELGWGGQCAHANALQGPYGVAVSPDGRNVYTASGYSDAVAAFSRE